jgi:integrase
MRLSEATNLRKADFNDRQGILTIRETKFHKSRLVPLHPSATKELRAYARKRDQIVTLATTDHFFLNDVGTPLYNATVDHLFRKLCNDSSIAKKGLGRQPRLHDLRHTFACRRVQQWYDTGANVNHVIAALSTYLGHAEVTYTYWYLTATPE